jgi:hypothetical protein
LGCSDGLLGCSDGLLDCSDERRVNVENYIKTTSCLTNKPTN